MFSITKMELLNYCVLGFVTTCWINDGVSRYMCHRDYFYSCSVHIPMKLQLLYVLPFKSILIRRLYGRTSINVNNEFAIMLVCLKLLHATLHDLSLTAG